MNAVPAREARWRQLVAGIGVALTAFLVVGCAPGENVRPSAGVTTDVAASLQAAPSESPSPVPDVDSSSAAASPPAPTVETRNEDTMIITIGDQTLDVALEDNSSVDALRARLSDGPVTLEMSDYGSMEKVGPLGFDLPRNDRQTTTASGDVILYQGGALVIYYAPNTWSFTRLGRVQGLSPHELKDVLAAGQGDIQVTLSLD